MTTQSAMRLIHVGYYWVSFLGTLALFVLASALIFMPLGQVVFDYWTPKVQSLLQSGPPAATLKGKAR